ncbi:MAG: glycosyltransferase family 4 protein [Gemmatimonadaceae bacterium]|nr:glycosyltransferase family 4 protein [Gemmatimonadaceae bacterium]
MSGPTRQALALAPALSEAGWTTTFVATERDDRVNSFLGAARAAGTPVAALRAAGARAVLGDLAALLRREPCALVCSHSYRFDILLALLRVSGRLPNPWVLMHHGATAETAAVRAYHGVDRQVARLADSVVVVAQRQLARFNGLSRHLAFVPNAVLPSPASASGAARTSRPAGAPRRLLFLGRLSPEKAPDRALQILRGLHDAGYRATLTMAGDGPARDATIAMAASLGLQGSVDMRGHVPEPWSLYAEHDVLLLPSRSEGMPNAVLEAIDAGMPVVAADVGEVRPILDGAPALGSVVPATDVVAAAIGALVAHPWVSASAADRRAQRAALLARYSVEERARRVAALYDAAMQRRARRRGTGPSPTS